MSLTASVYAQNPSDGMILYSVINHQI